MSWTFRATSPKRELALFCRQYRVEHHLEQDIAELLFQVLVAGTVRAQLLDRFQGLVRLFQEVAGQALVRLRPVPWAPFPQGPGQLLEPDEVGRERLRQLRQPQARKVVRLHHPVEILPGDNGYGLVGQAEVVQDGNHCAFAAPRHLVHHRTKGQFHFRQNLGRIALANQQGPERTSHLRGKTVPVHHPHALSQRVDAQGAQRRGRRTRPPAK